MQFERVCCLVAVGVAAMAGSASGGVNVSTYADQATYNGTPTISTSATPQALMTVNNQIADGNTLAHTFRTTSAFQLDKIDIYSGGKGGGTAKLNIYPDPVGGEDADGFVNTSFSTDLFNGGAGLDVTINGSGGAQYITFDLTGADEIFLQANQQYCIEIDMVAGQFSWLRSGAGTYPDGNLYAGASELNFNGTPPASGRGERFQVGGTPQRDGGLALFAVPEPGSLSLIGMGAIGLLARRRPQR